MIPLFQALGLNVVLIIALMCLGYFFREGIKNFFAEKILEKQQEYEKDKNEAQQKYNDERDRKQQEFQSKLSEQNADLQKKIQEALEEQRIEFQKELQRIDYKNDYYKKIIDKRIDAYERISNTVLKGSLYENINQELFYGFFMNGDKFHEYHTQLIELHKYLIWYNKKILDLLNKYIYFIGCINEYRTGNKLNLLLFLKNDELNKNENIQFLEISAKINKVEKYLEEPVFSKNDKLIEAYEPKTIGIGIALYPILNSLHQELLSTIDEDFKNLYDIEKFFNDI